MVGILCVTGGTEGDGPEGTSTRRVGWGEVIEQLDIAAEFKAKGLIVQTGTAGDYGRGAECRGNAGGPRELVEATEHFRDNRFKKNKGEAAEREAVGKRTEPLLDGADGAFHFADVTISATMLK